MNASTSNKARGTATLRKKPKNGRIRCLYPITLSLSYNHQVTAKYYGKTSEYPHIDIFTFKGNHHQSLQQVAKQMHQYHLTEKNLRGSPRYIPKKQYISIHFEHNRCNYVVPWPTFFSQGSINTKYIEISDSLCLRQAKILKYPTQSIKEKVFVKKPAQKILPPLCQFSFVNNFTQPTIDQALRLNQTPRQIQRLDNQPFERNIQVFESDDSMDSDSEMEGIDYPETDREDDNIDHVNDMDNLNDWWAEQNQGDFVSDCYNFLNSFSSDDSHTSEDSFVESEPLIPRGTGRMHVNLPVQMLPITPLKSTTRKLSNNNVDMRNPLTFTRPSSTLPSNHHTSSTQASILNGRIPIFKGVTIGPLFSSAGDIAILPHTQNNSVDGSLFLRKDKDCTTCCAKDDLSHVGPYFHAKKYGHCCICFTESKRTLWYPQSERPATLADLPKEIIPDGILKKRILPDDTMVANPCKNSEHLICIRCVRYIILNCDNHPINRNSAAIACISTADKYVKCDAIYTIRDFIWVLDQDEFQMLCDRADKYKIPGYDLVKCPIPSEGIRRYCSENGLCNAECMVRWDAIDAASPGRLVVKCSQNRYCRKSFCYHCKKPISVFADTCDQCITKAENENPEAWNKYFYNPKLIMVKDGKVAVQNQSNGQDIWRHLLKNKDITVDIAFEQITHIMNMKKVTPICFVCGVAIYKTSQCNGMSHCGIEQCYICGRTTNIGGHLEASHWDETGERGCPRFDSNIYWNRVALCNFKCTEDICYSDQYDCQIPDHQPGIHAMHNQRKFWHLKAMLRSLDKTKAHNIIEKLNKCFKEDTVIVHMLQRVKKYIE